MILSFGYADCCYIKYTVASMEQIESEYTYIYVWIFEFRVIMLNINKYLKRNYTHTHTYTVSVKWKFVSCLFSLYCFWLGAVRSGKNCLKLMSGLCKLLWLLKFKPTCKGYYFLKQRYWNTDAGQVSREHVKQWKRWIDAYLHGESATPEDNLRLIHRISSRLQRKDISN